MIYTIISLVLSGLVGFGLAIFIFEYKLKPKQENMIAQQKELSWRTSWAVLNRLKNAAMNPPSLNDFKNINREVEDPLRTVLLSDLQEFLHHAGVQKKKPPTLKQRQAYFDMVKRVELKVAAFKDSKRHKEIQEELARDLKIAEHPDNPLP